MFLLVFDHATSSNFKYTFKRISRLEDMLEHPPVLQRVALFYFL